MEGGFVFKALFFSTAKSIQSSEEAGHGTGTAPSRQDQQGEGAHSRGCCLCSHKRGGGARLQKIIHAERKGVTANVVNVIIFNYSSRCSEAYFRRLGSVLNAATDPTRRWMETELKPKAWHYCAASLCSASPGRLFH